MPPILTKIVKLSRESLHFITEMEQAKSHSEVVDREVVYDSNAGSGPEAPGSFSISDDDILRAQGHKAVFKRSFSIVSSLGFAFKYVSHSLYFALIILNCLVSRMLGLAR